MQDILINMTSVSDHPSAHARQSLTNKGSHIQPERFLASLSLDQHPDGSFIRDLAWSLLSPQIIDLTPAATTNSSACAATDPWHPDTIQSFIREYARHTNHSPQSQPDAKSARLGQYFESLIELFLSKSTPVEHLLSHQKVYVERRTLGEFDYLYRPVGEADYTHLEITVKFFLQLGNNTHPGDHPAAWIGLNPRDTLAHKIDRMRSHQLRLSTFPAAQQWLQNIGIHINRSQAIFRGRLFYPWQAYNQRLFDYPESLNPDHLQGWWLRHSELQQLQSEPSMRLQPLPRLHWLAAQPASMHAPLHSYGVGSLSSLLQQHHRERPVMVARWTANQEGGWRECDRGVITPDHWPVL